MTTVLAPRTSAPTAAVAASGGFATLVGVIWFALGSQRGQQWDESAMNTVTGGRDTQLAVLSVLGYVSIGAIVAVVIGCVVVALLRGRLALAAAAVAVVAGANVTTQLLKHSVLHRPDLGFGTLNSLPSGHTTVVASAVGAALLVAPAMSRPLIAIAGGFATTLTGASTVVAGWHRPSDVIAALAVSLVWTAVVALLVGGRSERLAATTVVGSVVGCGAALLFLVAIGVRPVMGWDGFTNSALVLGAVTAATALFIVASSAASPTE